jgi:hypothetical protein
LARSTSPGSPCTPWRAQTDVTMNVYTEVSDGKTLKALKRLGKQLDS